MRITRSILGKPHPSKIDWPQRLFQLLLGTQLRGVSAHLGTAVVGTRRKTSVALTADLLVAVGLAGQHLQRGLHHDTTTQTHDEVQGGASKLSSGFGIIELDA